MPNVAATSVKLQESLGISGAAFARRLRRKDDWGDATDPLDVRVQNAVKAFLEDTLPYSFFVVGSDQEFHRVILGMNGSRGGPPALHRPTDFVAFTAQELRDCGIEPRSSPEDGDTPCRHANSLHWDMTASKEQIDQLCRTVMSLGRPVAHLTKSMLKPLIEQAIKDQCLAAVPDSAECKAEGCPKPDS